MQLGVLTPDQIAAAIPEDRTATYRAIRLGRIQAIRIGGRLVVLGGEAAVYIAQKKARRAGRSTGSATPRPPAPKPPRPPREVPRA